MAKEKMIKLLKENSDYDSRWVGYDGEFSLGWAKNHIKEELYKFEKAIKRREYKDYHNLLITYIAILVLWEGVCERECKRKIS